MSSPSPNCVGLTKIEATTMSFRARASFTRERWPACRAPIVGTNPTEALCGKAFLADLMDATVRDTFMLPRAVDAIVAALMVSVYDGAVMSKTKEEKGMLK